MPREKTVCITAAANLPSPVEPEGGPTIGIDQNRGRYEAVVCTGWTGSRRRGMEMGQLHPTKRRSAKRSQHQIVEPEEAAPAKEGRAKGRGGFTRPHVPTSPDLEMYDSRCECKKAQIGREDGTRQTIRGRCICASVTGDRVGSLTSAVSGVQVRSEALSTTTRRAVTSLLAGMTGCVARRISTHRIFPSASGGDIGSLNFPGFSMRLGGRG